MVGDCHRQTLERSPDSIQNVTRETRTPQASEGRKLVLGKAKYTPCCFSCQLTGFNPFQEFDPSLESITYVGWNNFCRRYSHKVKFLCIDTALTASSINLIRELQSKFGGELLPNLQEILIVLTCTEEKSIELVLGASVTRVSIFDADDADEIEEIFRILSAHCPRVERIALAEPDQPYSGSPCLLSLGSFQYLRTLHVHTFSLKGWYDLADCHDLGEILLMGTTFEDVRVPMTTRPVKFPVLQTLRIHESYDGEFTHQILVNSDMPSLIELDVEPAVIGPAEGTMY